MPKTGNWQIQSYCGQCPQCHGIRHDNRPTSTNDTDRGQTADMLWAFLWHKAPLEREDKLIMASAKLLRQLIKTGTEGNHDAFHLVSEPLIQEEREKNHHLLANDLEKILYGRRSSPGNVHSLLANRLPKDKERGLPLLQIKEPVRRLEDVVLSDENASLVEEILLEYHR